MSRIFTDPELEQLATPSSIRLERAAAARDAEEALRIAESIEHECTMCDDAYVQWIAILQDFVLERAGEARHDEALRYAAEYAFRPFLRELAGADARARAEAVARHLRASGSTFRIEEEQHRFRFHADPWGPLRTWGAPETWQSEASRLQRGNRYVYPSYGLRNRALRGARPLTQGRDTLPAYLAAEILFLEILPVEELGAPLAVITLGGDSSSACLEVYKDPSAAPELAFTRLGLAKPRPSAPSRSGHVLGPETLEQLATPLSLRVDTAARKADWVALEALSREIDRELIALHDPLGILITGLLTWIARHLGEPALEPALDRTFEVGMAPFMGPVKSMGPRDLIPMWAMGWRSHGATFRIEEEEERFVFRGRQLAACARYRLPARLGIEREGDSRVRYPSYGLYDAPAAFHVMREPLAMTCGKASMPVYSAHCHQIEIWAIDRIGHPLWAEHHALDSTSESEHVHYKDPAAWPESYYERVGRSKRGGRG